jgi:hypothetical protein
MLDKVKEEYREEIEIAYTKLSALLDSDDFYNIDDYTKPEDLELSKKAYKEMVLIIYSGEACIGALERKKVTVYKPNSYSRDKVEYKFRKVNFRIVDERLEYGYSSVKNNGYDDNRREGFLCISEIPEKESMLFNERAYSFYPYINQQAIDLMDEFIDICFKSKNRSKLKTVKYEFEKDIKDVVSSHLTKTVRDRKINSVLC